jgi:hypothetical protein
MAQSCVLVGESRPFRRAGNDFSLTNIGFGKTHSGFILPELNYRFVSLHFPTPHVALGVPPFTLSVDKA